MAEERKGAVTMRGNPMTLVGPEIKVGQKAPDFNVVGKGMAPATLDQFKGKVKIITTIPSLDTPVCDAETRRFNEEAANLPGRRADSVGLDGSAVCAGAMVRRGGRRQGDDPQRLGAARVSARATAR